MSRIDHNLPQAASNQQPLRKAEKSDTRQSILRHDPDHHRKKGGDGEEGGFKDPYEDLTDVSVPALRNFLAGLLDKIGATSTAQPAAAADSTPHAEQRAPASPKAAAAMAAYQTGAVRGTVSQNQPGHARPVEAAAAVPVTPEPPSALDQAVAGLDRVSVLDLMRELDHLSAHGVTSITLEKGDGFLASIRAGINNALSSL